MNLTSLPKINFYRNTPLPSSKPNSMKKRGGIGANFYSLDPDLVNQQRGSIKGGVKSAAKGAAYGVGFTVGAMENAVKGMVAAIFRKQNQRNRQKFNAARARSSVQADSVSTLIPSVNANTIALNQLGATTNSITSSLGQVLKIEQARYKEERLARRKSFKPTFTKREPVKFGLGGLASSLFSKMGSFWNAISGLIGGLLKYLFIRGILEWMADPKNKQKIVSILETGKKIVTFLYNFTKGRIVGIIDGLSKAFDGEKSLQERLGGALGALTNFGMLMLGIRWLTNPLKIIKDVRTVLGGFRTALSIFIKFLKIPFVIAGGLLNFVTKPFRPRRRFGRGGGALSTLAKFALVGGAVAGGVALQQKYNTDPEFKEYVDKNIEDATAWTQERWEEFSQWSGDRLQEANAAAGSLIGEIKEQGNQLLEPAEGITPIGEEGQTVQGFTNEYLDQFFGKVSERFDINEENIQGINESSGRMIEDLARNNKGLTENIGKTLEALNNAGVDTQIPLPEFSTGGIFKLPNKDKGGYIQGPKSGYPVSLDGGKSASFIGHGTEYVSKKKDGSAFVIPIDTPHTDRNPNLQIKRTQEALSQGYGLKGMSIGGSFSTGLSGSDGMFGLGTTGPAPALPLPSPSALKPSVISPVNGLSRAAELERIRGQAAIRSIGSSTNADKILTGRSRSPLVNQIAQDSLNRLAFGSPKASEKYGNALWGGTFGGPNHNPIRPIPGGLTKQPMVSPEKKKELPWWKRGLNAVSNAILGSPLFPSPLVEQRPPSAPMGGPTLPSSPPKSGPTLPSGPPKSGPRREPTRPYIFNPEDARRFPGMHQTTPPDAGGFKLPGWFQNIQDLIRGGNQSTPAPSSTKLTPRQEMLQQRYAAIKRSGDQQAIYDFQRRYGGRTPGIPTNKDGKGNSWGYKFGTMLENEFYDERWYEGGDGGTNLPDLPVILRPFLEGRSKGGGYKPKMHGPQIRMQPGPHELQYAPRGGWITGPISGYPVSVKGKNRPDFIAHGTEYIAKKPTGEYSVLPYHGKGGEMEKLSRLSAGMEGFKVPSRAPRDADFRSPSSEIGSVHPGKPGFFLGGFLKGAGNFISGAVKGIGSLFGGGSKPAAPSLGSFDVGDIFNIGTPKFQVPDWSENPLLMSDGPGSPGGPALGGFDFGNIFNIDLSTSFSKPENPWANLNPLTQASIAQGQKWGFQYNDDGSIKGGSIIPGIMRQAGGLGREIGAMFGNEDLGGSIGGTLFKIFGGGGSNPDGSPNFNDILQSAAGLAGQLFKDKEGLLGDIGNYSNIFFGPGADRFTFGEKVALAIQHGLHGSKYSKYVRPIAQALGVDINNSVAWARELNGEGLAGPNSDAAQAASEVGPSGPNSATPGGSFDEEAGMQGGGLKAAIKSGKGILSKGFSVFNHPYFRNNKWSEFGANTGIGFAQGGGEKAVGQRHAMGLALNVGDFRETGRLSRLTSLANDLYSRKQDEKLVNVTYDNWGSWMLGEEREGPGKYGFPDTLHLGYAKESKGSAGSSLGPVQGGLTEAQAMATAQTVGDQMPSSATVAETAAAVNAITNDAQRSGGDLGSVLADYGFNNQKFFDTWNSDKLAEMYDPANANMDFENIFGSNLGVNYAETMQMATDPNTLFGSLVAEGKPEGEAENMVNAFNFVRDGEGLKFKSDSISGYEAPIKLDFGLGSMGTGPVDHFTTDTLDLVGRNTYERVSSSGSGENYGKSTGPNQFPFFPPKNRTPQESQQQQGPATGDIEDVARIPNNPAGAQEGQEGVGPDMKGNNVSQRQSEISQNAEKTGAYRYATQERSFAQSKITEQGSNMVRAAIARVEGINADVKSAVADAQARVAQMQQASGSQQGTGSSQQAGNIGLLAQMGRFLGPG